MKVVAFNGSPRKEGNTWLLVRETMRGAHEAGAEVTVHDLNWMNIKPCQHCGRCYDTDRCALQDDIQRVHEDIRIADRIVLASPIFFLGVTAQAKTMIDRCQPFWAEKYLRLRPIPEGTWGRKGLLILVGGMKRGPRNRGFEVSGAMATAFFRTVNVPEHAVLGFDGVDGRGAIREHPTALREAYEAGIRLAAGPNQAT